MNSDQYDGEHYSTSHDRERIQWSVGQERGRTAESDGLLFVEEELPDFTTHASEPWSHIAISQDPTGLEGGYRYLDQDWRGVQTDEHQISPWHHLSTTTETATHTQSYGSSFALSEIMPSAWQDSSAFGDFTLGPTTDETSASVFQEDTGYAFDEDDYHYRQLTVPEPSARQSSRADQHISGTVKSSLSVTEPWDEEPYLESARYLSLPYPQSHSSRTLGSTLSTNTDPLDDDSMAIPDVLLCPHADCNATFTGLHRRGTLQRHIRIKHGTARRSYLCEEPSCSKVFLRTDARLKHYRSHHPHLAPKAKTPRRFGPSSSWAQRDQVSSLSYLPTVLSSSSHHESSLGGVGGTSPYVKSDQVPKPEDPSEPQETIQNLCATLPIGQGGHDDDASATEDCRVECDLCESAFQRPADLKRHLQKHEEPLFACEVALCDRKFYRKDKLRDHVRQAHKGRVITTEQGVVFDVPVEATMSKQPASSVCEHCAAEFATPGELRSHINRKHVRRFQCGECTQAFHLNADLKRHQATVHELALEQNHPCPKKGCTQTFARKDHLLRHEKNCKHRNFSERRNASLKHA
jgi:hypothetical protein